MRGLTERPLAQRAFVPYSISWPAWRTRDNPHPPNEGEVLRPTSLQVESLSPQRLRISTPDRNPGWFETVQAGQGQVSLKATYHGEPVEDVVSLDIEPVAQMELVLDPCGSRLVSQAETFQVQGQLFSLSYQLYSPQGEEMSGIFYPPVEAGSPGDVIHYGPESLSTLFGLIPLEQRDLQQERRQGHLGTTRAWWLQSAPGVSRLTLLPVEEGEALEVAFEPPEVIDDLRLASPLEREHFVGEGGVFEVEDEQEERVVLSLTTWSHERRRCAARPPSLRFDASSQGGIVARVSTPAEGGCLVGPGTLDKASAEVESLPDVETLSLHREEGVKTCALEVVLQLPGRPRHLVRHYTVRWGEE